MTPRRFIVAALIVTALATATPRAEADEVLTRAVECTATRGHLITANPNRLAAIVTNVGTIHVNVGRGATMFALHVGSSLELLGYLGGLDCQTGGGSNVMEIYEESR